MMIRTTHLDGPFGPMLALATDRGIAGLYFPDHRRGPEVDAGWEQDARAFDALREQLAAYLDGRGKGFDLPLDLHGTAFQREVWAALREVPYGETTTYGELAGRIGRPTGARAVAGAVARNPVSIVVPCHRVVGASGALTGFAGGTDAKRRLLELEGVLAPTLA
jgi:methylated-DNA-[protein]-cysteine S-methyltransferase